VKALRVAIVHDWLVSWRGGEKVLEAVATIYPDAEIFTLFCDHSTIPSALRERKIHVHPVANRLKFLRKALLPLMPIWIEEFNFSGFDLVVSTSSCVAKGIIVDPEAKHLCYIHSPMRYIWDQREEYLGFARKIPFLNFLVNFLSTILRIWDTTSATRVDLFVANSSFVKKRIKKYYGRDAVVVPPPVDVSRFSAIDLQNVGEYFLAAGALVGYKRFDLAIKACERLGRKLVIAGNGPELNRLRRLAGPNTRFVSATDEESWVQIFSKAKAFVFPGVEDFGITAIEAMAAGVPVIALKRGGALDFVVDQQTGVFFDQANEASLCDAITRFEALNWRKGKIREFSMQFSREKFVARMRAALDGLSS
jgi:glycosyltransferase involved in cell wall biosynthesis